MRLHRSRRIRHGTATQVRQAADNGTALYYVRYVPKRLHGLTSERKIRIPLGLDSDAPLKAVQRAVLDAQEEFEARMALLESSSSEMLTQDQIDHNVVALLRKAGMSLSGEPMPRDFHPARELTPKEIAEIEAMTGDQIAEQLLAGVDANPIIKEAAKRRIIKGAGKNDDEYQTSGIHGLRTSEDARTSA